MAKAPDLKPNGRPRADDGKGTKQVPLSKGGNDRLAARLKRDHPEIAARVANLAFLYRNSTKMVSPRVRGV